MKAIKEALDDPIPFILLLPRDSNIPAQKAGHGEGWAEATLWRRKRNPDQREELAAFADSSEEGSEISACTFIYHHDEEYKFVCSCYSRREAQSSLNDDFQP